VVRLHGNDYRRGHPLSMAQRKVMGHIAVCRTAALGGHVDECDSCGHTRISYNSCRDRHCPKCQARQQVEWLTERFERLLPVPYFHVVFTMPDLLNPLALRNKAVVYRILFDAASQTLLEIAKDPRHLGAEIGITALLHTWGQNLLFHPHLHCVVTGGGLSADQTRWVPSRERYLLPVKVLARLFRGKFLAALEGARKDGLLHFAGSTEDLSDPATWRTFKDKLYRTSWVVYSKPPFGGPEHVFHYLGRYTHRIAISNHRITDIRDGKVTFIVKDYADNHRRKSLTLDAVEFLRRFLLHVLPHRFVRIRHYGLCAARNVHTKLATAQRLLAETSGVPHSKTASRAEPTHEPWWQRFLHLTGIDVMACPACTTGRLVRRRIVLPGTSVDLNSRAPPYAA
jgi:hypothetical protein